MQDREMQRPANGPAVGRRLNVSGLGLCLCSCLTVGCTAAIRDKASGVIWHYGRLLDGLASRISPTRQVLLMVRRFSDWPDSHAASQHEGWAWPGVGPAKLAH
jgi:hypothetical protein